MAESNLTHSIPSSPSGSSSGTNLPLKLHDIRGPVEIPSPWDWLWQLLWIGIIALILWGLWKAWLRWKNRPREVQVVSAHTKALAELEQALSLLSDPNAFCTRVSTILRRFLESRFNLHAPERTTEEFLHELRIIRRLTPDQKETLAGFLSQCDLVKFARLEPSEEELLHLHRTAKRLIQETEPEEQPQPQKPPPPALPAARNDPKLESA